MIIRAEGRKIGRSRFASRFTSQTIYKLEQQYSWLESEKK